MASVTKMTLAAKVAENRIRLDIGDDLSIEDEVMIPRAVLGGMNNSLLFSSGH